MNSKVKKLAVAALSVSFVTAATFGILPLAAPNAFNGTGTTVVAESATVSTESELQAALNEGGEVILGKDIVITETITITIPDVTVTLDLAGYTVSKEVNEEIVGNNSLIVNKGNLTVTDTSEEKTGKISYNFNGTSTGKFAVTAISNQQGTLTVKGGTIESLSAGTGVYPFTIDNLTNGNGGNAVLNVEGGVITAAQGCSIRGFANSTANECVINITGGEITGQVWLQDPSVNANKGTLTITGGTISENAPDVDAVHLYGCGDASGMKVTLGGDVVVNGITYLESYYTTKAFIAEITGGTYNGYVWVCTWTGAGDEYTAIPAISGGTFTMGVAEEYIAEGFELAENEDGAYGVTETVAYLAKIGDEGFETVAAALDYAQEAGISDLTITLCGETTKESALELEDSFDLYTKSAFNSVTFTQEDSSTEYYINDIYTGKRTNGGAFVFDNVNIVVTDQYMFEGNVRLTNNSVVKSVTEANCFLNYSTATVEPGSKLQGVIDELRGGTLIVDGGRTDGAFNETPDMQDSILTISWSGDSVTVKNGAYVKVNAANEVGRVTVSAGTSLNVEDAKFESWEYIANAGTINVDTESSITTQEITGAGVISIDASALVGGTSVQVITADMSGFTGTVEIINNEKALYEITDSGVVVTSAVASVTNGDGTSYYASLQEAFEAAQNGDTITLLSDLTLESDLNNAQKGVFNIADGVSITLDLGGYTISVTDNSAGNFIVFYNYGEFTIKNGTVNLTATKDRDWGAESTIILNRGGVLNIENGTYTHKGGTDMAFVVDNNGNAFGDATTNIFGGELDSTYTAIRNRMDVKKDGNGTGTTYLNISGGTISGMASAIWAQAASTSTTSPATGVINVSGGTISLINTARSDGAKCMTTISDGSVEAVKCEVGELTVTGGEVGEVTVLSAKDEAVDYVITEDGAYVAYSALGRIGVIRNIATTNEAGEDRYQVVFLCGIDSLNYKAVGFEVTVAGVTKTIETSTVYTGYIAAGEEYAPSAFGATSEYIFAIAINFPTDFASEAVEVRAFYEDKEGNVVYGETKTCDYIYNK